ncbi:MAG TPA: hypothetical protein VGO93_18720 [Candidatus Xenobia bacterium]|jgi:hypothetical protein
MKKLLLAGLLALTVMIPAQADYGRHDHDGDDRRICEARRMHEIAEAERRDCERRRCLQLELLRLEQLRLANERSARELQRLQQWQSQNSTGSNPIQPVHVTPSWH